jgi:hypothetical protein
VQQEEAAALSKPAPCTRVLRCLVVTHHEREGV